MTDAPKKKPTRRRTSSDGAVTLRKDADGSKRAGPGKPARFEPKAGPKDHVHESVSKPARDELGRLLPGHTANPTGRPKGSKWELGEEFHQALARDFAEHGRAVIEQVRENQPAEYLKVIARVVPKDVNVTMTADSAFIQMLELMRSPASMALISDGFDVDAIHKGAVH